MSNNTPDYENNLAFAPRHDETAYELQLKVNKLEKQLKIAVEALQWIYDDTKGGHIQCDACGYCQECEGCVNQDTAEQALEQIKELDK